MRTCWAVSAVDDDADAVDDVDDEFVPIPSDATTAAAAAVVVVAGDGGHEARAVEGGVGEEAADIGMIVEIASRRETPRGGNHLKQPMATAPTTRACQPQQRWQFSS